MAAATRMRALNGGSVPCVSLPAGVKRARPHIPITRLSPRCSATEPGSGDGARASSPAPAREQGATTSGIPSDAVDAVVWGGRLPSRRRLLTGVSLAGFVALGGNLGGITSALLGFDGGKLAASTGLDIVVPVKGKKRCRDNSYGYEFVYLSSWLADQTIARRNAERMAMSLDPPSLREERTRRKSRTGQDIYEPTVAFGPMGGNGEENVSVVLAPIAPGFTVRSLGTPESAAETLLSTMIAPRGSNKVATIIQAGTFQDRSEEYLWFEYVVKAPRFARHNVFCMASRDGVLFTLNMQCPESKWEEKESVLRECALSFRLLPGTFGAAFPPAL